jgi:citrate lyase gamma subunit
VNERDVHSVVALVKESLDLLVQIARNDNEVVDAVLDESVERTLQEALSANFKQAFRTVVSERT